MARTISCRGVSRAALVAAVSAAALLVTGVPSTAGVEELEEFLPDGGPVVQEWTVPEDVCEIVVDAYGAQGGSPFVDPGQTVAPGRGGWVQALLVVTPGETLEVRVGLHGGNGSRVTTQGTPVAGGTGGFPNGADGGTAQGIGDGGAPGDAGRSGGGGGGSSDVTQAGARVVVAGGGGGVGGWAPAQWEPAPPGPYGTPGGAGGGASGGTPDGDGATGDGPGNGGQGGQAGLAGGAGGAKYGTSSTPGDSGAGEPTGDGGTGGNGGNVSNAGATNWGDGGGGGGGGGGTGGGGGGGVDINGTDTAGAGGGGSNAVGSGAQLLDEAAGANEAPDGLVQFRYTPDPACTPEVPEEPAAQPTAIVLAPRFTG